jgi:hypothetical protein
VIFGFLFGNLEIIRLVLLGVLGWMTRCTFLGELGSLTRLRPMGIIGGYD